MALSLPAASRRARSFHPPPLPIVEGQIVVAERQPLPTFYQPSPEQLHQEQLREVVRTATIEARMAIQFNEYNMAEWYKEKRKGWIRASEEFQEVARDVRDVELAQETCELQRQMQRRINSEEQENSRQVRIGALQHEEHESRSAKAAADHAHSVAKEEIYRDRLLQFDFLCDK